MESKVVRAKDGTGPQTLSSGVPGTSEHLRRQPCESSPEDTVLQIKSSALQYLVVQGEDTCVAPVSAGSCNKEPEDASNPAGG